jgi:hypothetical protein
LNRLVVWICNDKEKSQMNAKKIISTLLVVVGIILLILSLIADKVGIGKNPEFGTLQITGVVAGAIMAIIGLILISKKKPA